jgi:hypothetical protein
MALLSWQSFWRKGLDLLPAFLFSSATESKNPVNETIFSGPRERRAPDFSQPINTRNELNELTR